jgi:hypothetical protein
MPSNIFCAPCAQLHDFVAAPFALRLAWNFYAQASGGSG